jgi:HK97 family phage major capsid protein
MTQFADEKNKKYPIDTPEHIRAAWNYIHQDRNRAKYSAEEVSTIEKHIAAAWKDQIDKAGPPAAKKTTTSKASDNDSFEEQQEELRAAWDKLYRPAPSSSFGADIPQAVLAYPGIINTYPAFVVVCDVDGQCYKVGYTVDDKDNYTFADRPAWILVERDWVDETGAVVKMSSTTRDAIKVAGDWTLDVLGVPFGGPRNGKDDDGQYFTPDTKIREEIYKEIPAFYYHSFDKHGNPQGDPVVIGKATYDHKDARGHWYKVVLDQTKEFAQRVWAAAQKGAARASSGTLAHLLRFGSNGEILHWPVAELSLMDSLTGKFHPANSYAVALPAAKATFEKAGLTLVVPPDEGENITATSQTSEGAPETGQPVASEQAGEAVKTTQSIQGAIKMTPEELQAQNDLLQKVAQDAGKAAADEAIKAMKAAAPAPDTAGHVEVVEAEGDRPFKSLAEQAGAVKMAFSTNFQKTDQRLLRIQTVAMKANGATEAVPADAGYLLEPTIGAELIKPLHEEGPFSSLVRRLPVGANSNFGYINGIDETSRATGSRWGGVRGYRIAEAASITSSRPKFRRINWELKKYAVLMYATDELIADSAQFNVVAQQSAGEELAFMVNDDLVNGTGVGGPQGVLQSGALVTVTRTNANAIVHADILAMWQRLLPRARKNAQWFINSEAEPQLDALYFTGATSGVLSPYVSYGQDGVMRVMGKEVHVTEFNAALGTAGDIILADMSEFLFWEKGDVQAATSIHIAFLTDEQAFRFIYRCDGQTTHYSPITPYKGTLTQSAFVNLLATS